MTKMGNGEMAFIKLEDLSGIVEIVVFPKVYAQTGECWNQDLVVEISGRVDEKEDRLLILAESASRIDER